MQWERHKGQEKRKQKHTRDGPKSRKCNGKGIRNGKRGSKNTQEMTQRAESVMWKKQEIEKTDGRIYDSGKG